MSVRKNIRDLVGHVDEDNYDAANENFEAIMAAKAKVKLEQTRKEVAQKKFGGVG